METRKVLLVMLALVGLGVSTTLGETWTADPYYDSYPVSENYAQAPNNTVASYAAPYGGAVTTTTVTTYPAYAPQANYGTAYPQPVYSQPTYTQPAYAQPAYSQTVYSQPAYVQPVYTQPVYAQPTYTSRPVVASYTPVEYRPVVASYAPAYVAYQPRPIPAYSTVTYRAPVACATPVATGPRVIVHPKVYVEGQPIRNILRAITP
jgi:hypothetical protein